MTFFHKDTQLESLGDRILDSTFAEFSGLARNQLAMTWIVYDPPVFVNTGGAIAPEDFWQRPVRGYAYRGVENVYPASVVKLFYLVAAHEWLERGMIPASAELDRALRDMIVDSSNDATGYVVDVLTGTTGGPEIPDAPFETWKSQRNIVNRYFQSLGWDELTTVNINQKTWCDGPYGRERAFYGENFENRNMLTTNAAARLLHSIVGGVAVTPERSRQMMSLMQRSLNPADLDADPENQVTGFVGAGVPPQTRVWSKAGLTSQVRHDAVYVEFPDVRPYLLIVFMEGKSHSTNEAILPFVSLQVLEAMKTL